MTSTLCNKYKCNKSIARRDFLPVKCLRLEDYYGNPIVAFWLKTIKTEISAQRRIGVAVVELLQDDADWVYRHILFINT